MFLENSLTTIRGLTQGCNSLPGKQGYTFGVMPRKTSPGVPKLNETPKERLNNDFIPTAHLIRNCYLSKDRVHLRPAAYYHLVKTINKTLTDILSHNR